MFLKNTLKKYHDVFQALFIPLKLTELLMDTLKMVYMKRQKCTLMVRIFKDDSCWKATFNQICLLKLYKTHIATNRSQDKGDFYKKIPHYGVSQPLMWKLPLM